MFNLTRAEQITIAVVFVLLMAVSFGVYIIERGHQHQFSEFKSNIAHAGPVQYNNERQGKQLTVHISGEVENPGIFQFPEGTRVYQALAKAKVKQTGYVNHINQAMKLYDGQSLHVSSKTKPGRRRDVAANNSGKININTAAAAELETLSGIGPVYAQRIIEYRSTKPFSAIEEITRVRGIGLKTFANIKDKICVR